MTIRWSEDEFALYMQHLGIHRPQAPPVSEKVFMDAVVRLAKEAGYLVYHTHTSKRSPEGFPDLICARAGSPLLAIETKTDTGQVTLAQEAWLTALGACTGVVADIWLPKDLEEICRQLRG